MRTIIIAILIAFITSTSHAEFPIHSNISTVDVSKVKGDFSSFSWVWVEGNSQTSTVYVVNKGTAVDLTDYGLSFKLAQESSSGRLTYFTTTNISVVTNAISFYVDRTNIPANGPYQAELFAWQGSTNLTRSLFQGMVNIMKSLF